MFVLITSEIMTKMFFDVIIYLDVKRELKMYMKIIAQWAYYLSLVKRVIYKSLFSYFFVNRNYVVFNIDFILRDTCIGKLLSIILEIKAAFDSNPTVDWILA